MEFRKKPVVIEAEQYTMSETARICHSGKHAYRLADNERERAFAERWELENADRNIGCALAWILHAVPTKANEVSMFGSVSDGPLTQEEATAAATVIQWLGSNVGWNFLEMALAGCGYKMVKR